MNRIFKLSLLLTISLLTFISTSSFALNNVYTVHLYKVQKTYYGDDGPIINPNPSGQRDPSYCIPANISLINGIEIPGINKSEILGYYVYDEKGTLLNVFNNEKEMVSFIFSQKGLLEIKIEFDTYWLRGFINC